MSQKKNHQQGMDNQSISELRVKSEQNSIKQALKPGFLGKLSTKKVIEYINTLRAQCQQAEQTYTNHINDLTKEKEQMHLELKSMQDQINGRKKVIEERNQLRQKTTNLEKKIQEYDNYASEIHEKVEQFESEIKKSADLRKSNEGYQVTIEQLNQKVKRLTDEMNLRDNSQIKLIEDNERLLNTVQQLKECESTQTTTQLTEKITQIEEINQSLVESNKAFTQKNDVLESNVNNLMLEQREQAYANTTLKNEVSECEEVIATLLNEKASYETKSIDLANQLEVMKAQSKSIQDKRDYFETKLKEQQSDFKQLSHSLEYMTNLEAKIKEMKTTMEQRTGELRNQLLENHDCVLEEMQSMVKKTSQMMLTSAQQETDQLKESQTQYMNSLLSSYKEAYHRIASMTKPINIEDDPVEIQNKKTKEDKKTVVEFKQSLSK